MLAAIGDERAHEEIERARQAGITIAFSNRGMAGYAEAIQAGRAGEPGRAVGLAGAAEAQLARYPVWADLARMYAAEAALADGWAGRRSGCAHRAGTSPLAAWPGWSAGVTRGSAAPRAAGPGWA